MKADPQKILIIRASSIGDILLATPLVRLLRRRFPSARIDFVIKSQFFDVMRSNPHLNTVYKLDTKTGRRGLKTLRKKLRVTGYDLVVDVHNNFRSSYLRRLKDARIVTLRKYKLARFFLVKVGWNFYRRVKPVYLRYIDAVFDYDITDDNQGLEFFPEPEVQVEVDRLLKQYGWDSNRLTLCIAPGASKATKQWPPERFAKVAKKAAAELNAQILLLGDKNDAVLTNDIADFLGKDAINLAGTLDIMQAACALNRADAALTNDSGLMHLATALGKPTVAVFGSTSRELGFFPVGKNVAVVENKNLSCRPCTHIGRKSCPQKHFKCMMDVTSDNVYAAVERAAKNL